MMGCMAFTLRTGDARRPSLRSRRACALSGRNRPKRFRAALLAVVWMLPGIWCAAHALAHEFESDHHQPDLTLSASFLIPAMSCDHDHTHSHPDADPVLQMEGAKKPGTTMLVTAGVGIEGSNASRHRHEETDLGRALRRAVTVSGPRAPPIS